MKTTYRTTHSYKPRSRAERALTLAVLTALLSGAAAAPAMAKDRTIEKNETVTVGEWKDADHRACLVYKDSATEKETDTNNITNSPSGNTLTILGTVKASGYADPLDYSCLFGGQMFSLTTMYSSKAVRLRVERSSAAGPRTVR